LWGGGGGGGAPAGAAHPQCQNTHPSTTLKNQLIAKPFLSLVPSDWHTLPKKCFSPVPTAVHDPTGEASGLKQSQY
jgi:hypothetical protein